MMLSSMFTRMLPGMGEQRCRDQGARCKGRLPAGGSLSHAFREAREGGGGWRGEETGRERGSHSAAAPQTGPQKPL